MATKLRADLGTDAKPKSRNLSLKWFLMIRLFLFVTMLTAVIGCIHIWFGIVAMPMWRIFAMYIGLLTVFSVMFQPVIEMAGESLAMQSLAQVEEEAEILKYR